MALNREKNRQEKKPEYDTTATILNELSFENLKVSPPLLPTKAKALSEFRIQKKENSKETSSKETSHPKVMGIRINSRGEEVLYHLKSYAKYGRGSPSAQLEGAWSEQARYLADAIPLVYPVFDENNLYSIYIVAVKDIPNFNTNAKKPLQEKDIQIDFFKECYEKDWDIINEFEVLQANLEEALACYQTSGSVGFLTTLVQAAKDSYNQATNSFSAAAIKEPFTTFLEKQRYFDLEEVLKLLKLLRGRLKFILNDAKHQVDLEKLKLEKTALEKTIDTAENLVMLSLKPVVKLQEVLQAVKAKKAAPGKKFKVMEIADDEMIEECGVKVTGKDLKNFYRVKIIIKIAFTRWILKDTDGHNQNWTTEDPFGIDWDWAKLNLTYSLHPPTPVDYVSGREPKTGDFKIHKKSMLEFPVVKKPYAYWMTKNNAPVDSSDSVPLPLNYFTPKHTKVNRQLEYNPCAIFFKYQTALKFILTSVESYQRMYELHYKEPLDHPGIFKIEAVTTDDRQRISELSKKLVEEQEKKPEKPTCKYNFLRVEFKKYISYHGNSAYKFTLEEMHQYRSKYENKIRNRNLVPKHEQYKIRDYERLVKSMDQQVVKQKFDHIKNFLFHKTNVSNDEKKSKIISVKIRRP